MIGPIHIHLQPTVARPPEAAAIPRDASQAARSAKLIKPDDPVAKARADTELTDEEKQQVQELKQRDAEVRAHEQAHKRAGGPYASAPTYQFTRGPDGRQYAVSGEVKIDASEVAGNPKATIQKMEIVIRAALAPAEPSGQDMKVAAQARASKTQAQIELRKQEQEGQTEGGQISLQERYGLDEPGATSPVQSRNAAAAYNALEEILQPHQATAIDLTA